MLEAFLNWLTEAPIWMIGGLLFAFMVAAAVVGYVLRIRADRALTDEQKKPENQEGYIVSAVLGLLALLMGFTLSIALDRFDARRVLVLHEANAIHTAYLRAQLLGETHRVRLSNLLVDYVDNRIVLAKARRAEALKLIGRNDELVTEIWAATAAAFDSVKDLDFSAALVEAANEVIEVDASRKASRAAHVPTEIFAVLLVYLMVTAGVLGHVLIGWRGQVAGGFLLVLLTTSLLMIVDIDRPTLGGIRESQGPMETLRATLKKQPPEVFDRWRDGS